MTDRPADHALPENNASSWAGMRIPILLFALCLLAQLYLVFFKSFNWDEFLHFRQIYELREGTLFQAFQVIHLRMLWWVVDVSPDVLVQMTAARVVMWVANLVTLFMIYALARQFGDRQRAFLASFAYLGAGYVFTQAFSIRADPLVTATLMTALAIMARGPLGVMKATAIGALIGLAMMMTVKAVFYAPCFAGIAWMKFRETPRKRHFAGSIVALLAAAILTCAILYFYHTWGFPKNSSPLRKVPFFTFLLRWLNTEMPFAGYIRQEIIFAPVFFLCLFLAPLGWSRAGLSPEAKIALSGFLAPLAVFLFYRNTFPYFFVFILAPASVAIAPFLGVIRDRYGANLLAAALSIMPLASAALEPREMLWRQRALIDYVHREYPQKTGYLDYSGIIADYPRVMKHLTSGNGIRLYHEQGDPIIAREVDRGNLPFIIANNEAIRALLLGRPFKETFLPADVAAVKGNYVQQWGVLWREGIKLPAAANSFQFKVGRAGDYIAAGAGAVDGKVLKPGMVIRLERGNHTVSGPRATPLVLWRGNKLPSAPPAIRMDSVFTRF